MLTFIFNALHHRWQCNPIVICIGVRMWPTFGHIALNVSDFLEKNDVLYKYQYGFRKNHSTITAVIELAYIAYISMHLDQHDVIVGGVS